MSKPGHDQARELPTDDWVRIGILEELRASGMTVVHGGACPLLVVHDRDRVFALDDRCPHLGFPLHRRSVEDGILTCHWHHAHFDLISGETFDLWAGDVPTAPVELRDDGALWVAGGRAMRTAAPTGATGCARACSMISVSSSPRRFLASVASASGIAV
jgi:nitrite reductase/ring-hydroxylating ferredoxin subunit